MGTSYYRLGSTAASRSSRMRTIRATPAGQPRQLEECDLAGGEVIHAADDVDLLARVKFLDDRRRALQSSHLPSHVLGNRVVEQVAGLRLLGDDDGRFDRGDEIRQMARKDGLGLQHFDCGVDRTASAVAE